MHAVALYASGSIALGDLNRAKSNPRQELWLPNTMSITNREKVDGIGRPTEFSATGWAEPTASLMQLCEEKLTEDDMVDIIRLAKSYSRASRHYAREAESESDPEDSNRSDGCTDDEEADDEDDSILRLRNGSATTSSSPSMAPSGRSSSVCS